MNEEKLVSLFDKKLDKKLNQFFEVKLNQILDKRFDEFHTKLSKEISEVFDVFSNTLNNKFKSIETTLNEHTKILNDHTKILNEHTRILNEYSKILNEHSKMLNTLIVSSTANELKHQTYDSELGIINTNLFKHDSRLQQLESANFEKIAN